MAGVAVSLCKMSVAIVLRSKHNPPPPPPPDLPLDLTAHGWSPHMAAMLMSYLKDWYPSRVIPYFFPDPGGLQDSSVAKLQQNLLWLEQVGTLHLVGTNAPEK